MTPPPASPAPPSSPTEFEDALRLEVVVDKHHEAAVLQVLRECGASAWTVLPRASGYGDRGTRSEDDLMGDLMNVIIIVVDAEAAVRKYASAVGPVVKSHGGLVTLTPVERWIG